MGSLASSAMLCVVTGGSELRFNANMRRFRRIRSSDDNKLSGVGDGATSLRESQEAKRGELRDVPVNPCSVVKQTLANAFLNFPDSVPQLLRNSLAFEGVDCVGVSCCRHDDESDDGHF